MRSSLILVCLATLAGSLSSCGDGPASFSKSAERGRVVFLESSNPHCGMCHRLNDAEANGPLGPDLDKLRPPKDKIILSVTHGVGVMPAQKGVLSPGQIEDVANYVLEAAGRRPK